MTSKFVETNLDEGIYNNSRWIEGWAIGDTGFHHKYSYPFLDEREAEMFEGNSKSIFLPLCGKTLDMLWMYNKGHTVCGIDIAEQPLKEFFEEHDIDKDVEELENAAKLYKSKDGRLKMYMTDFFDATVSMYGQFDIIYDVLALVAVNVADRLLYRDVILQLLKPGGAYYLNVLDYDPVVCPGPPHSMSDWMVRDLYGKHCEIDLVEETDKTGQDLNILRKAAVAVKSSSYVYDRWYKMMLKQ